MDGRLIEVHSPLAACAEDPSGAACAEIFSLLKNPYYLGDEAGLTQSLGWADAWTSMPSVYAVAAERTEDVVAAVNFARENRLRLVVKGGGHSYQGTSNAADSLLVWTRRMNDIVVHDAFVGAGCAASQAPVAAVTIGAGALWGQAYDTVAREARPLRAGRRVSDGGRRGADPERRLRALLEGFRDGGGEPGRGRDRHGGRGGADRQSMHAIRSCSGASRAVAAAVLGW